MIFAILCLRKPEIIEVQSFKFRGLRMGFAMFASYETVSDHLEVL